MFNLSTLDAFKIQKCPGSCQLVFFTVGPMTIRIKKKAFVEMVGKLNDFVTHDLQPKAKKKTEIEPRLKQGLALVK